MRQGSAGVQPFAFTGREWDGELGLYYYLARYYDPEVGRFLSRDPLGLAAGPNPYTYVDNSPTNNTDSSGQAVDLCRSMRPWSDACFWRHYLYGRGKTVDLIEVGLLEAMRATHEMKAANRTMQLRLERIGKEKARELCDRDCDKGTKAYAFSSEPEHCERVWDFEPGLYVLGGGSFWTSGSCSGSVNCKTRTCSFDCRIRFTVRDMFEDPFSIKERTGVPFEVGVPYPMKAEWEELWAGGGRF